MSRLIKYKGRTSLWLVLALVVVLLVGVAGVQFDAVRTHATGPAGQYKSYDALIRYIAASHKAPFVGKQALTEQQWLAFARSHVVQPSSGGGGGTNIKVNQDHNPWPKLEVAAAVSPLSGQEYVVITNDFRQGYDHMFYHSSSDGGLTWSDDSLTQSIDGETTAPYSYQSNPGVVFDRAGHSFISNLAGNLIIDGYTGYVNYDNEIDVTTGFANGSYTDLNVATVDYVPCNGNAFSGIVNCPGQFDRPFITVDDQPGSPHKGTIYVYYTYFCNGVPTSSGGLGPCTDGNATIQPFSTAILVSHAPGIGMPFSPAELVSGPHANVQFADLVIDKQGEPHIFFDDYTSFPIMTMYESSLLINGSWKPDKTPIVTFTYNGLNNTNWQFNESGTLAPACSIRANTAYCAFSASQIGSGPLGSTPSVYLAVVDAPTGATVVHRVNNDPLNDTKDHFFPWASVAPGGAIYVGWYDNRNDPFNSRVQYFVGKSIDGGKTFPAQKPVSDALFNPCLAYPFCLSFGDYTQLVTGPDGVTHATWSDTRDGASAQLYTQAVTW